VPSVAIAKRSPRLLEDKKNKPNVEGKHGLENTEDDVSVLHSKLSTKKKMSKISEGITSGFK
jgi:hypothetical protein